MVTSTAIYKHTSLNLQKHLLALIQDEKRPLGSFERSFPDVFQFLEDLNYDGVIPYKLLNALLAQERKKSGSPLEIPGLKVATSTWHMWGIAILLAIQIYLYLHLEEFASRARLGDEALKVAWIGLYSKWSAFLVCSISMIALPVTVASIVLWNQLDTPDLFGIVSMGICLLSLSTAVMIGEQVRRLCSLVSGLKNTKVDGVSEKVSPN